MKVMTVIEVRKNGVRLDDVGSILKFRIGFALGENSAGFCRSVWLLGSILSFRIGSILSIGGLIAATLFAATISDCHDCNKLDRKVKLREKLSGLKNANTKRRVF